MNIKNLTLKQIQELQNLFSNSNQSNSNQSKSNPFEIGKAYFIRTVTMSLVGKLKAVYDTELVLEEASWVADSGRFHDMLKKGLEKIDSSEIEPFIEDVIIGRGALIDATIFSHNLPTEQK